RHTDDHEQEDAEQQHHPRVDDEVPHEAPSGADAEHAMHDEPGGAEERRGEDDEHQRSDSTRRLSRLDDAEEDARDLGPVHGKVASELADDLLGRLLRRQDESDDGDAEQRYRDEANEKEESEARG